MAGVFRPPMTGENHAAAPAPRIRIAKRLARPLARPLWWLLRPLMRPLAWRARSFLLAETRRELAELRAGQERLAASLAALARQTSEAGPVAQRVGGIEATLETALLTLAVPVCPPAEASRSADRMPPETVDQAR